MKAITKQRSQKSTIQLTLSPCGAEIQWTFMYIERVGIQGVQLILSYINYLQFPRDFMNSMQKVFYKTKEF